MIQKSYSIFTKQFFILFYTGFNITRCIFLIKGKEKSNTNESYKLILLYRFRVKLGKENYILIF